MTLILCACGCGTLIKDKDTQGRPQKYVKHHHQRGRRLSEEAKRKIGKAHKGKIVTEETKKKMSKNHADINGEKNPFFGKRHTPEALKKMSENRKGKNAGEKHHYFGKHRSEEVKRKISDKNKGQQHSEEAKKKISEFQKGKIVTKETKKKMSAAQKGHPVSDETKRKQSENHTDVCGKNNPMYGKITHGRGIWFTAKNGNDIFLRSSWELMFANRLDASGLSWKYEPSAFQIIYQYKGEEKEGTYTPDFWINEWQKYIEVKGFWRDDAYSKFNSFCEQYPHIDIELVMNRSECDTIFNRMC